MRLRSVREEDYRVLFNWRTDAFEFHLWDSLRRLPTFEDFKQQTQEMLRRTISFMVIANKDDDHVGLVQAYGINPEANHCFTMAYIAPAYRRKPHAAEGYIALLESLFRTMPLRKVYADIFDFNSHPMKPLMAGGFVEEGCFREHTWHDDRYWDVTRLAMYRERWMEVRARARRLLGVSEDASNAIAAQHDLAQ